LSKRPKPIYDFRLAKLNPSHIVNPKSEPKAPCG
jgi:hypothetical protein